MAKGNKEIKGWITRAGVHIPIYEEYTADRNESKLKSKTDKKYTLRKHYVTSGRKSRTANVSYSVVRDGQTLLEDGGLKTFSTQEAAHNFMKRYDAGDVVNAKRFRWIKRR